MKAPRKGGSRERRKEQREEPRNQKKEGTKKRKEGRKEGLDKKKEGREDGREREGGRGGHPPVWTNDGIERKVNEGKWRKEGRKEAR